MAASFGLSSLLIVLCFSLTFVSISTDNCKFMNKKFLWCKNGIPDFSTYNQTFLEDVTALWINHCDYVFIESEAFQNFKQLNNLKVACEKIEIADEVLDNLVNVSLIEIEKNAINFPKNIFCSFNNLKHLWLKRNQLSSDDDVGLVTNCSSISQNIQCGQTITWLSLAYNNLTSIKNDGFLCNLRSLSRLDLSNNAIYAIDKRAFEAVPDLLSLKLAWNLLSNFSDDIFVFLNNLLDLDLSHNRILFVSEKHFNCLPNLSFLKLSGNSLTELKHKTFENVSDLIRLDISDNKLSNVSGIFTNLIKLKVLNVSGNRLEQINSSTFSNLLKLDVLHLEKNLIGEISEDSFAGCPNMTKLDLSYNKLKEIPNLNFSNEIASVHLQHNRIKTFPIFGLNLSADLNISKTPNHLMLLDLSFNNIEYVDDTIIQAFSQKVAFNSIEKLDLSHNQIVNFYYPSNVFDLNLAHNKIKQLPLYRFGNPSQIERINLSHNLIEDVSPDQFPMSLTHLSLDFNNITYFNPFIFKSLVNLKVLYVRNNSLTTLSNLIMPNSIWSIDIRDNPWSCNCALIQSVFNFIQTFRKQIVKATQLSCHLNDDKKLSIQIVNFNISQCTTVNS